MILTQGPSVWKTLDFNRDNLNTMSIPAYFAIFFISFSILLLEIMLTKIFSVTLWYHFSYLVISLAMFGIGFGGIIVYLWKESLQSFIRENVYYLSIFLAVSIIVCLHMVLHYNLPRSIDWTFIVASLFVYLICTWPFVIGSIILSLFFLRWPQKSSTIYSFDLMGAAIACIGSVVLITYLSAQQVILIASGSAIIAAILFDLPKIKIVSCLLLLAVLLLTYFGNTLFPVDRNKVYSEVKSKRLYEKWSPLSRITVFPIESVLKEFKNAPFGWGMSSKYNLKNQAYKALWIDQDANAGTPIVAFDGDYKKVDFLQYDVTSFAYHLINHSSVFIIGVGGGRDVLTALTFNSKTITGVDVHPIMVDLIKNTYADFAGHIYDNKKVTVAVSEGRSYLSLMAKSYDIIQIPLIDSWAATVAGAFAMSENSLYTIEAFAIYLDHLTSNGLLSVSRFYYKNDNQTIKIALLARKALEQKGIRSPENHIVIVRSRGSSASKEADIATVLVKNLAFSTKELNKIKTVVQDYDFDLVYFPGENTHDVLFQEALTTKHLDKFIQSNYYDIRVNTDDRPFFFQMFYFSKILDFFNGVELVGQSFNFYGVVVLTILFFISVVLLILFYAFPLFLKAGSHKPPFTWGAYFFLLGLAFMLIEIPVLQLISLYLGGAIYGLSVGLFCLLFFSGLGSMFCHFFKKTKLKMALITSLFLVSILTLILPFYLHGLIQHTFNYNWYLKLFLMVLMLLPMAFNMGMALPLGLHLIKERFALSIPWFWALNGAASVLGSIIAMALSILWGYSVSLILAALLYFAASFFIRFSSSSSNEHKQLPIV